MADAKYERLRWCPIRNEDGNIVIEAALILPFFICFALVLNAFIQVCRVELNLQTAVNETVKTLAADFYPGELLYLAGKDNLERSKAGELVRTTTGRIGEMRNKVIGAEDFIEQYRSYIPTPVIKLAELLKTNRENLEQFGKEEYDKMYDKTVRPAVNLLFTEILTYFSNQDVLKPERLRVVHVEIPVPGRHDQAKMMIEAEYDYPLSVPFLHKTIKLKKRAVEWAWTGN